VQATAAGVQSSGREVVIAVPIKGHLRIAPGPDAPGETLSGPSTASDEWRRLESRIARKAAQSKGTSPAWIYIIEGGSLWYLTPWARLGLEEKLDAAALMIQPLVDQTDHLAGVILSNSWMWDVPHVPDQTIWTADHRSVAIHHQRSAGRTRETVIIGSDLSAKAGMLKSLATWFSSEAMWLDWALSELGLPSSTRLLRSGDPH